MKKLAAILLTALLATASVVSASAFSPLQPEDQVMYNFNQYINKKSDNQKATSVNCIEIEDSFSGYLKNDVYAVIFTSENAEQEPYFNTFGKNNEFYECSGVTNQVFKSGIAVFSGFVYDESCKENFYSLSEMAETTPEIIDSISDVIGKEYVGRMGDADCDGKLSVNDVTKMQNILAGTETVEGLPYNALDINDDGKVSVNDITELQDIIAKA
ncbi:dockerin type I repeat-containing protein [Ruminococcus sp.]|uniref:dockerin type I repeat-containing protein n=1 Tax=Ruminococcus sp. TaxID=41978 RepID=UPI00386ABDCC